MTNSDIKILIAEDSAVQAEKLRRVLAAEGYSVFVARDGAAGLLKAKELKPSIVISDIIMPEMNGFELCRHIKSDADISSTPVILLTSLSDPTDVISGLACGADNFIVKPYDEDHLISKIKHIFLNRELRENSGEQKGVEIHFDGRTYFITSEKKQILDLLISTYESAVQKNTELIKAKEDLEVFNEELEQKVQKIQVLNDELTLRRQEAEEAKARADAATQAKSDFLANMSHELRTPLNSIIGFSEVLRDELIGPLNTPQLEDVHYILIAGKHLLSLINDILDLSKVESGKMELEYEILSLVEALNASMVMQQEKAMKHGIALGLEITPEADIEIEADARKLKQIMFNLINNAVKFTPDGGSVQITARKIALPQARYDGMIEATVPDLPALVGLPRTERNEVVDPGLSRDYIEISVSDTGIGIKSEDMPRLFHEFTQLQTAYSKEYEGTGLGLALTKKLVGLHGGRIWVESEFGKGSMFAFVIPVKQLIPDERI